MAGVRPQGAKAGTFLKNGFRIASHIGVKLAKTAVLKHTIIPYHEGFVNGKPSRVR